MSGKDNPEDVTSHEIHWDNVGGRRVRSLRAGLDHLEEPPVVLIPGLGALGHLIGTLHGCSARMQTALLDVPGHDRPEDLITSITCPVTVVR
jgi:hypothetical protein